MAYFKNSSPTDTKYTNKLSCSSTTLTGILILPISTQAAIIQNTSQFKVSQPAWITNVYNSVEVDWDIDGNSIADFRFNGVDHVFTVQSRGFYYNGIYYGNTQIYRSSAMSLQNLRPNAQGLVKNDTFSLNLALSAVIGPTIDTEYRWSSGKYNEISGDSIKSKLQQGNNFIGFNFRNDTNQVLYGWAQINLTLGTLTIEQWAYEDSGSNIKIGQQALIPSIPLPASAFLMLSGLAMGAGGILRRRKLLKNNI